MDNWTLSPEQVHSFAQNGYLRVPNVLADWELAALQRESSAWIAADRHRGGAPGGDRAAGRGQPRPVPPADVLRRPRCSSMQHLRRNGSRPQQPNNGVVAAP